ncbi:MAG: efflux RND transporter periplasmic adaptor subunit [Pseudomonadota bacterium]
MSKTFMLPALLAATALSGAYYAYHNGLIDHASARVKPTEITAPSAPQVVFAHARQEQVSEWDTYPARFEAIDSVDISSRLSGHLTAIHFREGDIVEKGEPLFTIDQRPFQAALSQARASVAEAEARLELANTQLQRTQRLVARKVIAEAKGDQDYAEMQAATANLKAAKARLQEAELNLEYTLVRAPITGRVDETLVDLGALVRGINSGATHLTTIVALDPIHLNFEVDQNAILKYQRLAKNGIRETSRSAATPVLAALPDTNEFILKGAVDFVGNRIDPSTGTIRMRARLANPDHSLTPGMFARAKLLARNDADTILVPDEAIAVEQTNRVVLVIGADDRIESRVVEIGPLFKNMRVVRAGLKAGERVVVEGHHRARPGETVSAIAHTNKERLALAQ